MDEDVRIRYADNYELVRYRNKKELLEKLHNDIVDNKNEHYIKYKKYRKICLTFNISIGICSGVTVGTAITGFVFPLLFVITACTSATGFFLDRVKETTDVIEKREKFKTTYQLLDDLARDVNNIIIKNGYTANELEELYRESSEKYSIILSGSIL